VCIFVLPETISFSFLGSRRIESCVVFRLFVPSLNCMPIATLLTLKELKVPRVQLILTVFLMIHVTTKRSIVWLECIEIYMRRIVKLKSFFA